MPADKRPAVGAELSEGISRRLFLQPPATPPCGGTPQESGRIMLLRCLKCRAVTPARCCRETLFPGWPTDSGRATALPKNRCPPTSTGRPFFNWRRRDYASAIFPENPHYFLRIFRTPLRPSKNALPVTFFCEQAGITLKRDSWKILLCVNS